MKVMLTVNAASNVWNFRTPLLQWGGVLSACIITGAAVTSPPHSAGLGLDAPCVGYVR